MYSIPLVEFDVLQFTEDSIENVRLGPSEGIASIPSQDIRHDLNSGHISAPKYCYDLLIAEGYRWLFRGYAVVQVVIYVDKTRAG